MVKGTVTITLSDYHAFLDQAILLKDKEADVLMTIKELQVFLSFMVSRSEIEPYVEEFNKQSKTSIIQLNNGIAKITNK
jgi:hypothetical protein|tara:strand:- start:2332 stop:2568 length:237 start_codon:yes stop_codon:yes gene_type:complete